MNTREVETNKVTIVGTIREKFIFNHELYGEKFYTTKLEVERMSGITDKLPVVVSERLIDVEADSTGKIMAVMGQLRTFNRQGEQSPRCNINVFAQQAEILDESIGYIDNNAVFLDGYICKQPKYRKTPLGRNIADMIVAVNRPYGRSDYIPCIVWGRNALYSSKLEVGTSIKLQGRFQSREYRKILDDVRVETRTAYELSVSLIEVQKTGDAE